MRAVLAAALLCALASALAADQRRDLQRADAQQEYRKGESYMREEHFDQAAAAFKRAVALDPEFVLAWFSLGQCQMALKRYPEAVVAYEGARDAALRVNTLGTADLARREREREDEVQEIRQTLQRLRSGQIKFASAQLEIQLEERLRLLEDSRHRGREGGYRPPAEIWLGLGSAYFRSGRAEDAEREWKEAASLDPKLGPAHNNLAVVYMLSGRFSEAKAEVRAAEKAGFPVSPQFKEDLKKREAAAKK